MARPRTSGSRFKLGKEIDDKISDFCAANLGLTNATELVRKAVGAYIEGFLATDKKMRDRYDEARRARLNIPAPKVVPFSRD